MKCDWDRHSATVKHSVNADGNPMETKKLKKTYTCGCSKKYYTNSGFWKHKKTCILSNEKKENVSSDESEDVKSLDKIDDKQLILMLLKDNQELKQILIEQSKENKDLTNTMIEQHSKVLEMYKETTNTNGTYNMTNINSNNKSFNLQFFLNETCKDAMNIKDFVNSVKIQLDDLEKVGEVGYIDGISNIIIKNLKELDITQRPVHCTDKKREVLYIKDEDKWEKEDEQNKKIRGVIKQVAHKNTKLLKSFREKHPDCGKSDSKYSDQYNKLIIEVMGGKGDNDIEKEDKIIQKIAKEVVINK
jgi:hypothetical protein